MEDRPGRFQEIDDSAVFLSGRRVLEQQATHGDPPALGLVLVLDADAHTLERAGVAPRVARFGVFRRRHRLVEVLVCNAVDRAIERFDAPDLRFEDVDRRELAAAEQLEPQRRRHVGELVRREPGRECTTAAKTGDRCGSGEASEHVAPAERRRAS